MRKIIFSAMLGNGLEWYDYALYAYTTLIFSKLFFPAGNEAAHLLATLGIFAVGFIARPFGGIMFGVMGDKLGRRTALAMSIFMMAIPTGCIGLLPTYSCIGLWAPALLVLLRVLQGLSLGGAFSGSMTFLVEHAPPLRRGIMGSASVISLVIGFLLGSVVAALVKAPLSDAQFADWGWRIPFVLGIPIGLIGLYIREHCEESPTYEAARQNGELSATPVRDVLAHEMKHVLQAIGIYITVTMPFYLLSAYFITFSEHTLGRSKEEALILNSINMAILLFISPLSAWLSDRYGRRVVLAVTALAFLFFTWPVFTLMMAPGFLSVLAAQALFAVIVGFYIGPVPALLVEIFPTRLRYTAMALSYNICAALFGGTAPMVSEWLITT
ncbi:MAG: MFS transporter, partial [Pseudomonadota bacterium]|nr:MFS transporter [Pseudomonadota bacterium]